MGALIMTSIEHTQNDFYSGGFRNPGPLDRELSALTVRPRRSVTVFTKLAQHLYRLDVKVATTKSASFSILAGRRDPVVSYFNRVTYKSYHGKFSCSGSAKKTAHPFFEIPVVSQ